MLSPNPAMSTPGSASISTSSEQKERRRWVMDDEDVDDLSEFKRLEISGKLLPEP